jgi:hypothetical protein
LLVPSFHDFYDTAKGTAPAAHIIVEIALPWFKAYTSPPRRTMGDFVRPSLFWPVISWPVVSLADFCPPMLADCASYTHL